MIIVQTWISFINKASPEFHTLLDSECTVRNHHAVRSLPTIYLFGPDEKIIGRIIGERD